MINIKELSVGNWIQNINGNSGRVIGITEHGEVIMRYEDNSTCYSELNMLRPIPVTEKILKNSGFGYIEKDKYITHFYPGEPQICTDMDLHIGTDNKGIFWINDLTNDYEYFQYVHQLQNIFTLWNIKIEIQL